MAYNEISIETFVRDFEDSIIPSYFIQNFRSDYDFITWLKKGSISDLKEVLKAFEKYEEYHHCKLILDILNNHDGKLEV